MLAQRTLEAWAAAAPEAVHDAVADALTAERDPGARARLVETVGLVPAPAATRLLTDVGGDDTEAAVVRAAALAALDDELTKEPAPRGHQGLTVAQLFLHGEVDGSLRHSGQGDTGGVATLLVHLGDALLRQGSGVARVITLSGGRDEATAVGPDEGGAPAASALGCPLRSGPPLRARPAVEAVDGCGDGLAAPGRGAARHPADPACGRPRRRHPPADGRRRVDGRRRGGRRARHPRRPDPGPRPPCPHRRARGGRHPDPLRVRCGRPGGAPVVPRPAAAPARRAGRAPRAPPASGDRAEPLAAGRHRRLGATRAGGRRRGGHRPRGPRARREGGRR